jgi:hypothetical protein
MYFAIIHTWTLKLKHYNSKMLYYMLLPQPPYASILWTLWECPTIQKCKKVVILNEYRALLESNWHGFQCHFVQHKCQFDLPGFEPVSAEYDRGDQQLQPCHGAWKLSNLYISNTFTLQTHRQQTVYIKMTSQLLLFVLRITLNT